MSVPDLLLQSSSAPGWMDWFVRVGRFMVDDIGQALAQTFSARALVNTVVFLVLIGVSYGVGRVLSKLLRMTVLKPPRVDDAVGRLLGHVAVFGIVLIGFSAGLALFGTSIAAFATGLGLLTLALGFGMQNTVANLMGGVSLAVDKPFRPGDRIEVGTYWGTVQTIGLRSTRILTPKKETVIVPNKIMEEREIWNYTLTSPEWRIDLDVMVAHDADWRAAEAILLEVATRHPNMLHYRPVQVLMREVGEKGVKLQLRAWIADVTLRAETISDLWKSVKDRFDEAEIEVPYPYQNVRYRRPEAREAKKPGTPLAPFQREVAAMPPRILLALTEADPDVAGFATSVAKALGAGLVVAYVHESRRRSREAEHILRTIREQARAQRVWCKPIIRTGPLVETLKDLAREEAIDLLLVTYEESKYTPWRRGRDVRKDLIMRLDCPVVATPEEFRVSPSYVEDLRERIKVYRDSQASKADQMVEEDLDAGPQQAPRPEEESVGSKP